MLYKANKCQTATPRKRKAAVFTEKLFSLGSLNGAGTCASTAFDAGVSVDNILAVAFGDSLIGALVDTGSTLNTIVADYVSHVDLFLMN